MVYRGALEKRCGPIGHRGFESHPLRLYKNDHIRRLNGMVQNKENHLYRIGHGSFFMK